MFYESTLFQKLFGGGNKQENDTTNLKVLTK
jgi:hypothetical protein